MNTILIGINLITMLLLAVQVSLLFYAGLKVKRFISTIKAFSVPDKETGLSPAGMITTKITDQFATSLMDKAKVTFMGIQSGQIRGQRAAAADVAEGTLSAKFPWLGVLLQSFPALRKTIRRAPGLVESLPMILNKVGGPIKTETNIPTNSGHNNFNL